MNNVLLVSSDLKKSGKTTIACQIIQKMSKKNKITGIKISTGNSYKGIEFYKEENLTENRDTTRMLAAGANEAYLIKTETSHIYEIVEKLAVLAIAKKCVVCESLSIRKYIIPGCMVFIKNSCKNHKKDYADTGLLADIILNSNDKDLHFLNQLTFENNAWKYKS